MPQLLRVLALLCAVVVALSWASVAHAAPREDGLRDVLVVSNNWEGTADLIDPTTFERIKRLDVVPDRDQRIAEIATDPVRSFYYASIRQLIGEGHDQYVDDGFTSPEGDVVYFSRPSFADVVAIDLATGALRWRTPIDGYRSDHMALSADGRQLLVSASTANVVDVLDTRDGAIVGRIPAGDQPHENNYSSDGSRIFQASIGTVFTATDEPALDATKGNRLFEVIDGRTLQVLETIDMGEELAEAGYPNMSSAVRPMAITPDERYVYFQVSFFFGIVQYDLRERRVVTVLDLPKADAEGVPRTDFLLDSAHHGLAMDPQGTKLCVAGTMSNYAAIVTREPFAVQATIPVGRVPYWSASSADGRHCFVSVAGDDRVAVISFAEAREVASIPVGDHPQRMRTGVMRVTGAVGAPGAGAPTTPEGATSTGTTPVTGPQASTLPTRVPGPVNAAPGADRTAPRVTVGRGGRRIGVAALRRSGLRVAIGVDELAALQARVVGRVRWRVAGRVRTTGPLTIATGLGETTGPGRVTVRLRPGRSARVALRRPGAEVVGERLVIRATDRAGNRRLSPRGVDVRRR